MTIKNIFFKFELEGRGVVNYDGNAQKFITRKLDHLKHLTHFHDNVSYAKKDITENGYKLKISADCIKKALFKNSIISQTPDISFSDTVLYSYLATPVSLLRGHMFASKTETLKRKGALIIVDAEQTNDSVSYLETCAKSGFKTASNVEADKSDNTFFAKENVGEMEYKSQGQINLEALQFISCDQVFDRFSFNPDKFKIFKRYLQLTFPDFDSELGYFKLNTSSIDIPERGFKLKNDEVVYLLKEFFKNMLSLSIDRRSAYARISKLEYKIVSDPLVDLFDDEKGWLELKTKEDVDSINLTVHDFYSVVDTDQAVEKRKQIEVVKQQQIDSDIVANNLKKEKNKQIKDAKKKEKKVSELTETHE